MPPVPVPAGDVLEQFACVVTSTADGNVLVTYAFTATTPSQGLTLETKYTEISMVDAASKKTVATLRQPAPLDSYGLRPAADGGVYFAEQDRFDLQIIAVTSLEPGTLKQRAHLRAGQFEQIYVTDDGYAATRNTGTHVVSPVEVYDQWLVEFFSGVDGSKIGEFANVVATDMQVVPRGFLMYHGGGEPAAPGVFFFDMSAKQAVGPVAPSLEDVSSYGDLLMLKGSRDVDYLTVYDVARKSEVFSFSEQQINGLKIDLSKTFLGAHFLYVTNESDNPVIDLNTSQPVHSGWSLVPLSQLKDGWVLIWPEGPGKDFALQGLYPDTLKVARGTSGDYDGPWF